jgi:hypothetical protein
MDQYRRQCINNIRFNISRLERSKYRDTCTLQELPDLKLGKNVFTQQKDELSSNISRYEADITRLKQEEKDMLYGLLDERLQLELKQQYDNFHSKQKSALKHRVECKEEKEDKEKVVSYQQKIENDYRQLGRDVRYHYKRFRYIIMDTPGYMQKNLKDMPNNKGYIWKGCWFMGLHSEEYKQPTIMFEKLKHGIMHIHEYANKRYKLFEKKGKDRKKLLKNKSRANRPVLY